MVKKEVIVKKYQKLDSLNFGFSGGIVFGACILILTFLGITTTLFPQTLSLIADMYGWIGYDITPFGIVLGTIYGFIGGFVCFWLIALIYNKLTR